MATIAVPYAGDILYYPMSDDRVGWIAGGSGAGAATAWTITPAPSGAWATADIWDHREVHLTGVWVHYSAAAANTIITLNTYTGANPSVGHTVCLCDQATTAAGKEYAFVIPDLDIARCRIQPRAPAGTGYSMLNVVTATANAADTIHVAIRGWYRDKNPWTDPKPEKVTVEGVKGPLRWR